MLRSVSKRITRPTTWLALCGVVGITVALAATPAQASTTAPTAGSSSTTGASTAAGASAASTPAAVKPHTVAPWQGLAKTPPMGWNDWSYYQCNISEQLILDQGRALVSAGLAAKGYKTVTTDDCWMQKTRDAAGNLQANTTLFPDGMAYVGAQLHKMGLKFGIYEDAGTSTCGGYAGSYDHWTADANLFASWGVDYLKLDGCNVPVPAGQSADVAYRAAYKAMSDALVASGRKIVYSESAPAYFQGEPDWYDVISWCVQYGNLWREGADIALGQESSSALWNSINYNYSYNAPLNAYAGPGHWNDPDFLLVGDKISDTEAQSQLTLWAEMAAPLISSTDLTKLTATQLSILGNRDIIAVDQDKLGVQGNIVETAGSYDILNKPLANGDRSVVFYNKGETAQTLSIKATALGLTGKKFQLKDLVSKAVTVSGGTISANVPPHGTKIFRVSTKANSTAAPATSVTVTSPTPKAGTPTKVTVTLQNDGIKALQKPTVSLAVPAGWTVKPAVRALPNVAPAARAKTTFTVTSLTNPQPGQHVDTLTATATYRYSPNKVATSSGEETVLTTVPYPSLAAAYNNVGVSDESNPTPGNLDGAGDSYSAQALATAGVTPGGPVAYGDVSFSWPKVAAGTADNVLSEGQLITVNKAGSTLSVLGTETTGAPSAQPFTLTYTDGSINTVTIGTPNWLNDGSKFGQTPVIHTDHRNTQDGPANFGLPYDVYANSTPLAAGKTLASVTLPNTSTFHVFDLVVS